MSDGSGHDRAGGGGRESEPPGQGGGAHQPERLDEFLSRQPETESHGADPVPVMPLTTTIADAIVVADEPAPLRAMEVYDPAPAPMAAPTARDVIEKRRRRGYLLGGVAVTALGLTLFVVIATGISLAGTLFLAPAALLLVLAAAWRPYYWLYLPGFALLGLGLGWIVDDALTPEPDVWLSWIGLGAGLLVAWGLRFAQGRRGHWLAPVTGAAAIGVGLLAGIDDPWTILWKGWPLLLVAIGVALVARALTMGRRAKKKNGPPAVR